MARRALVAAGLGLALVVAVPAASAALPAASAAVDQSAPSGSGAPLPLPHDPSAARAAGQAAGPQQPNQVAPKGPVTALAPFTAAPNGAVTFRVYATQYQSSTPGSVEVALPDKCAKFAALGLVDQSCPAGYQPGLDYRVAVQRASGQQAAIPVKDVGPWNIDDNYWDPTGGPRPRRLFTDLPQGTPEAQAAFYNGYHTVSNCNTLSGQPSGHAGPADQYGRCVLNPAGIDLSVAAAATLGLGPGQSEWVTVSFLWESSPPPPPNCTTYTSPNTGSHQVCGAIRDKYLALGGPSGFLGYPTTDELPTPDGIGRFNHFSSTDNAGNVDGSVYWTPATGAWSIHGAIRAKWSSLGWERSFLGYPITDEGTTPNKIGRYNFFSLHGAIYWTGPTGAWSIHGAILDKWAKLGYENSFLGFPITDEGTTPNKIGRYNYFSLRGAIYWTGPTGAWSIHGAILDKWASLGWETSVVGFPVTDETGTPDGIGRFNHFVLDGSIYWTPRTHAWSVHGAIRAKWASMGWERSCLGYPVSDEFGITGGRRSNLQHGDVTYSFSSRTATSSC
jgi:hypothetical protein